MVTILLGGERDGTSRCFFLHIQEVIGSCKTLRLEGLSRSGLCGSDLTRDYKSVS